MKNRSMHFVLSTDSKPRLKWTHDLHQRFIDAINQLGGADTTPKSIMRVMEIPGLTLYHLKSHLQKYRHGKSQQLETCSDNKQQDYTETKSNDDHCSREISLGDQSQITENLEIAQALEMQMEVEKKLYEQIEVQKHLQRRIEAQGKYLQSVLTKAQEALCGHNSSPIGIRLTKDELSQLVTMVNNACPSSPISELTETREISLNCGKRKQNNETMCSLESSLTSSESSERKEEKSVSRLMSVSVDRIDDSSDEANGKKRNAETKFDSGYVEESSYRKRCGNKLKKAMSEEMFDLNSQCQNDMESTSSKTLLLDLNCSLNFCEP
ncbi:myb family transcription factor PHL8-like isoform X2 [Trifolium pratense]|uniref:myb family transcription factor PHL8-like isoform X2 n=1 Tax=Trifolium pratense TaxID=57577 RepID=UPI001E698102|nr:myb family transcription factor PHL8-like isoform X2 [Trifolium pratense]